MQTTPFPSAQTTPPLPEEIAALAHQLHLSGGRQTGLSMEDWLCAEYFLTQLNAATEAWWPFTANAPTRTKASSAGAPVATRTKPAPSRKPRKAPRPARPEPTPLPLTTAAFAPPAPAVSERPMIYAPQTNRPQPAMAGFEMAIAHSESFDRWKGINE
jgi:hypothetical protein